MAVVPAPDVCCSVKRVGQLVAAPPEQATVVVWGLSLKQEMLDICLVIKACLAKQTLLACSTRMYVVIRRLCSAFAEQSLL